MEHTKGEIRVSSSNPESIYVLKDGQADGLFATCDAGDYARSQKEGYANAKELVRRWNAFEEDGLVAELRAALERLCKEYLQNLGTKHEFVSCITPKGIPDYWRTAEAAIAKAT